MTDRLEPPTEIRRPLGRWAKPVHRPDDCAMPLSVWYSVALPLEHVGQCQDQKYGKCGDDLEWTQGRLL